MRKILLLGLLLASFNSLGKTLETPTYLIQCQDCTTDQLRDWFFNTIVVNTNENPEKEHQSIHSQYRIIVHRPDSSHYDAFKVTAPVTHLIQGDIKPETFNVSETSYTNSETYLATQLFAYAEQIDKQLDRIGDQLSRSFEAANEYQQWLNSNSTQANNHVCTNDPQYLGLTSFFSVDARNQLQQQANQLFNQIDFNIEPATIKLANQSRFIKGTFNQSSIYLVKRKALHKSTISLNFADPEDPQNSAKATFLMTLEGNSLTMNPIESLTRLGNKNLSLFEDFGGEVSPCAIAAMNNYQTPQTIRQTQKEPTLAANVNPDNPHLCAYIYGTQDKTRRLILGATCRAAPDGDLKMNLNKVKNNKARFSQPSTVKNWLINNQLSAGSFRAEVQTVTVNSTENSGQVTAKWKEQSQVKAQVSYSVAGLGSCGPGRGPSKVIEIC
ncbi:hypothetical protein [Idiomarina sp.]|uniref:hypothetical protein n=1 Tax=Idiomarina sp. TaxID=1874361 RepID=UPI0025BC5ED7|nr:hypothetical protein [Idiomarina sp.]NQZ02975.1 hypothetical protein [Idiomarina sp.]